MLGEIGHNESLGATAHWIAAARAKESEREERLFTDPWAAALAGPEGLVWIEQRTTESVLPIILRTRYFDDFLQQAAHGSSIRQIVLMACGFDTRAYRLSWPPGTQVFELDQAPILTHKGRVLRAAGAMPTCERHSVPADLTGLWTDDLIVAGFDLQAPAAWLLEGFLFYLTGEQVCSLLARTLEVAAPASAIGFDIINALTLTSPLTKGWIQMQADAGASWTGTMDDPAGFLAQHGWEVNLAGFGAADASYGRWPHPSIPATLPDVPHLWYVTGTKARTHSP